MEQISLFDGEQEYRITKPIRLIELFAGIGAQAKALENLGVKFEHYRICEFDKYAVASYNAVHGTNFGISDITKIHADDLGIVDTDKFDYIMTYSFPCTDLSNAGKQMGMAKGSGTRSGLLWEVERLLDECTELPQVLLMENVTEVHGEKNKQHFYAWCNKLENLGYHNYWQDLNAKNYGIPQNRNRCFMLSILGDYYYEFPKGRKLELRLKDMLETGVDEKYYLSEQIIKYYIENTEESKQKGNGFRFEPTDGNCCGKAITTRAGGRMDDNYLTIKLPHGYFKGEVKRANIFPTIDTGTSLNWHCVLGEPQLNRVITPNYRIRKLTPKECWRLMGFSDNDIDVVKKVNSNAQLYKQAGNSIVVDVLMAIFDKII